MPISTNISTASSVSMEAPASTRSLMRFTMKDTLRFSATSQPWTKTGSASRGNSGYRKTDMVSGLSPSAMRAAYSAVLVSIA